MHWVTIVWSMLAAGCLMLALQHVVVWLYQRQARAHLLFAVTAASVAAIAVLELRLMHTLSTLEYGEVMRWVHVPVFCGTTGIVGFVLYYFGTGRVWLAAAVVGLRAVTLGINFLAETNLNYLRVLELKQARLLGEAVNYAVGEPNPWRRLGEFTGLLFIIFVVDASIALWRKGDAVMRGRALLVGGGIAVFLVIGHGQTVLIHMGAWQVPYFISLGFGIMILVMALELSQDVLRAAQLARRLKISEAGLRESEQRMELAASAAGLGMWYWDVPKNRIWATGKAHELYGLPEETASITLEDFLERVLEEDRAGLKEEIAMAFQNGGQFVAEYRVWDQGGSVQWIAARGQVEFSESGLPLRMSGVSRDISARKLAEEEAQLHRNEVAHLARVTTLGEISGSLVHELNQPLGAILANTEAAELHLQRETPDLTEVRNILADIRRDDLRAGEIIHGMRAFLRRQELSMEELNVGDLLRDTAKMLSGDAAARRTTLSLQIQDDLPPVRADRIHIQQVLLNLMVNGMEAMSNGPLSYRRLTLGAAAVEEGQVLLSVSDAGTGIAPAQLGLIFQPFHTSKRGGLGLGLAISQSIVRAHGGSLVVENNADRGATARVYLPCNTPAAALSS